jgi:hypothetical protein
VGLFRVPRLPEVDGSWRRQARPSYPGSMPAMVQPASCHRSWMGLSSATISLSSMSTELSLKPPFSAGSARPGVFRSFVELCKRSSEGTTNRVRLQEDQFIALEIPLPPLVEQRRIVARIEELAAKIAEARPLRYQAAEEAEVFFRSAASKTLGALPTTPPSSALLSLPIPLLITGSILVIFLSLVAIHRTSLGWKIITWSSWGFTGANRVTLTRSS